MRLLPVSEWDEQLFGESGADAMADDIESSVEPSPLLSLFLEAPPRCAAERGKHRRPV